MALSPTHEMDTIAPWSHRYSLSHPVHHATHHNALGHPLLHHKTPRSLLDQHFGLGLLNDDLPLLPHTFPSHGGYMRPWRHHTGRHSGLSNVTLDKDGFKVILDVQQFLPEEVTVKVVDGHVVVEGHHEERGDEHGYISRNFKRRYTLPKDIECDAVVSSLSSDGVLTVAAPKKLALTDTSERHVPIVHTQAPAIQHHPSIGLDSLALKRKAEEKLEKLQKK